MRFESPWMLLLGFLVLGAFIWRWKRPMQTTVLFSRVSDIRQLHDTNRYFLSRLKNGIRWGVLILMVLALARPQGVLVENEVTKSGIDIMLALDTSPSMRAEDFEPNNRLAEAKETIRAFVRGRSSDRVGLVVFGRDALTQVPLTLDYTVLDTILRGVSIGMLGDSTAVGMALATGLNRLKDSETKTRIMILLTDGVNNAGEIDPLTAADLAKDLGVKVYTIGMGKEGGAPVPYNDPVLGRQHVRYSDGRLYLTELDEDTLIEIADRTGGQYFRATDSDSLKAIYTKIDALEKSEIKTKTYQRYKEYFPVFLWLIFIGVLLERLIAMLGIRMVP